MLMEGKQGVLRYFWKRAIVPGPLLHFFFYVCWIQHQTNRNKYVFIESSRAPKFLYAQNLCSFAGWLCPPPLKIMNAPKRTGGDITTDHPGYNYCHDGNKKSRGDEKPQTKDSWSATNFRLLTKCPRQNLCIWYLCHLDPHAWGASFLGDFMWRVSSEAFSGAPNKNIVQNHF